MNQLAPPRILAITRDSDGKLGIENAKLILTAVITTSVDLIQAIKNRDWLKLVTIFLALMRYGNLVGLAQEAWAELRDTSPTEAEALARHFQQTFDIPDDALESRIEEAVLLVPKAYDLITDSLELVSRTTDLWAQLRDIFNAAADAAQLSPDTQA